ncbi:MAG: hypothetical protein WBA54_05815 [Acidaminobacteraceae bacterium]
MRQKNKIYIITSVLILIVSLLLIIKFDSSDSIIVTSIYIITLIIGIAMLNHWTSISYIWTCEVCDEVRELSLKENFIYINIGVNRKYFHCNECGVKRIFNGKYKYLK